MALLEWELVACGDRNIRATIHLQEVGCQLCPLLRVAKDGTDSHKGELWATEHQGKCQRIINVVTDVGIDEDRKRIMGILFGLQSCTDACITSSYNHEVGHVLLSSCELCH
jgi:hypothetical protein